jgi:hypothetical protein
LLLRPLLLVLVLLVLLVLVLVLLVLLVLVLVLVLLLLLLVLLLLLPLMLLLVLLVLLVLRLYMWLCSRRCLRLCLRQRLLALLRCSMRLQRSSMLVLILDRRTREVMLRPLGVLLVRRCLDLRFRHGRHRDLLRAVPPVLILRTIHLRHSSRACPLYRDLHMSYAGLAHLHWHSRARSPLGYHDLWMYPWLLLLLRLHMRLRRVHLLVHGRILVLVWLRSRDDDLGMALRRRRWWISWVDLRLHLHVHLHRRIL